MPAAAQTAGSARARWRATRRVGLRPARRRRGGVVSGREARPRRRPRSGSSRTAFSAVVPRSRPSSTGGVRRPRGGQEAPHALAVDRVPGAAVDLEVGADDDAVDERRERGDVGRLAPVLSRPARCRRPLRRPRARRRRRARAGHGPETRIASARDETTAERARTPAGRPPSGEANSGVMFIRTRRRRRRGAALAQQRGGVGLPQAHVALVDARQHLAHEAAPVATATRQRARGVPEVVDAERARPPARARPRRAPSPRRRTGGASSRYGPVVLVAEQHGVDALLEQDLEVARDVVDAPWMPASAS